MADHSTAGSWLGDWRAACEVQGVDWLLALLHAGSSGAQCGMASLAPSDIAEAARVACSEQAMQLLRELLAITASRGLDMESTFGGAFRTACERGRADIVRELLKVGGDNSIDANVDGGFGLRAACANGHLEVVHELLALAGEREVDVHAVAECAFRDACAHGHAEVVRELLSLSGHREVDVHAIGEFAIREACSRGHLDVVRQLLALAGHREVDVHVDEEFAFRWACAHGHAEVVRELLSLTGHREVDVHSREEGAFWEACAQEQLGVLRELLGLTGRRATPQQVRRKADHFVQQPAKDAAWAGTSSRLGRQAMVLLRAALVECLWTRRLWSWPEAAEELAKARAADWVSRGTLTREARDHTVDLLSSLAASDVDRAAVFIAMSAYAGCQTVPDLVTLSALLEPSMLSRLYECCPMRGPSGHPGLDLASFLWSTLGCSAQKLLGELEAGGTGSLKGQGSGEAAEVLGQLAAALRQQVKEEEARQLAHIQRRVEKRFDERIAKLNAELADCINRAIQKLKESECDQQAVLAAKHAVVWLCKRSLHEMVQLVLRPDVIKRAHALELTKSAWESYLTNSMTPESWKALSFIRRKYMEQAAERDFPAFLERFDDAAGRIEAAIADLERSECPEPAVQAAKCALMQAGENAVIETMLALLDPDVVKAAFVLLDGSAGPETTSGLLWDFLRHAVVIPPRRFLHFLVRDWVARPKSLSDEVGWQTFLAQSLRPAVERALAAARLVELSEAVRTGFNDAMQYLHGAEEQQIQNALTAAEENGCSTSAVLAARFALMVLCEADRRATRFCSCGWWTAKEMRTKGPCRCSYRNFKMQTVVLMLSPDVLKLSHKLLGSPESNGTALSALANFFASCVVHRPPVLLEKLQHGAFVEPYDPVEPVELSTTRIGSKDESQAECWEELTKMLAQLTKGSEVTRTQPSGTRQCMPVPGKWTRGH